MEKIVTMVNKITPFKYLTIKNNPQDWFDNNVIETIKLREKRLKQFKSTKLHIDEDLYKSQFTKKIKRKYWQNKGIVESSGTFRQTHTVKKVQSQTYVSKKMTKYALMIKQMQMLFSNSFAI